MSLTYVTPQDVFVALGRRWRDLNVSVKAGPIAQGEPVEPVGPPYVVLTPVSAKTQGRSNTHEFDVLVFDLKCVATDEDALNEIERAVRAAVLYSPLQIAGAVTQAVYPGATSYFRERQYVCGVIGYACWFEKPGNYRPNP